ncbi:MAG: class IIb bacteriocin, lactobin A/cerein 7B family [Dolichospermum sp. OL03]|uniref:class IIb bacteriocin, lactobin A/cerein 7B family n=1 Tax=Dolichospermum sp. LEGE 00240 TaxID=1828603 RepID=UPI00187FC222|nr:class IIb bacteriocin, lactobin A/cerein 7B family [Dolichospermum sp. LEGE 00240]MBS9396125.1 class IIb bacteriocin, lactobin A/cerein 7B family [Dolichospermum sp. OL01]MCO5799815.1 class IIb bacteriocin, lactobin A/cerein 7B family [Dolichospermum sp. OL03]MCS6280746.1 class IIb bacteriocin, lactobin A/cerein 7B family [Dolichospermum sp.]MDK2408006.1 class IIb bacteriocin, lactobin A/cerein 7B family [Aphanizomenon sp. 202]MDK2458493.1 class IIb bacteriocin, lactobin A/cerein 7B family 
MANIKINDLQAANLNPSTSELFNELTEAEISDIHGGWGHVAFGAAVGGIGNLGHQIGAGRVGFGRGFNWGSLGSAIVGGMLGGAIGPVNGAAAYALPRMAFFGGIINGRMGW